MLVRDLARRLGRPAQAVVEAVKDGRIPRAGLHPQAGGYVSVTETEVRRWRARSVAEALAEARAADPALPDDAAGWRGVAEVARALGLSYPTALRRLRRAGVPVLEWGEGTPFRPERRVYAPDLEGLRRALHAGPAPPRVAGDVLDGPQGTRGGAAACVNGPPPYAL